MSGKGVKLLIQKKNNTQSKYGSITKLILQIHEDTIGTMRYFL